MATNLRPLRFIFPLRISPSFSTFVLLPPFADVLFDDVEPLKRSSSSLAFAAGGARKAPPHEARNTSEHDVGTMAANKAILFPIVKSVVLCPEGGSEELLLPLLEFTRELVFLFGPFLEKNPPPPPPPPPENRVVKQLLEFDIFLNFCFQSDGSVLKKCLL
jgi:hypothetical protein